MRLTASQNGEITVIVHVHACPAYDIAIVVCWSQPQALLINITLVIPNTINFLYAGENHSDQNTSDLVK